MEELPDSDLSWEDSVLGELAWPEIRLDVWFYLILGAGICSQAWHSPLCPILWLKKFGWIVEA